MSKLCVINIKDYSHLTKVVEGVTVWDDAFNSAYADLQDNGVLIIPKDTYYFYRRSILSDKKGLTVFL